MYLYNQHKTFFVMVSVYLTVIIRSIRLLFILRKSISLNLV